MPGSPTGFKLINLLTPTPSDNTDSAWSPPLCLFFLSASLFLLFSARTQLITDELKTPFVSQYTENKSDKGIFSCANDADWSGAGAACLSEVSPVSVYTFPTGFSWGLNICLVRQPLMFPRRRTRETQRSQRAVDGKYIQCHCCHSRFISGWKQTQSYQMSVYSSLTDSAFEWEGKQRSWEDGEIQTKPQRK